jgi:hypothetical protein
MTDRLMNDIKLTSDTRDFKSTVKTRKPIDVKVVKPKITEKDVEKMYKNEREELWNKLIDNGVENLSENDKKVLQYLAKY